MPQSLSTGLLPAVGASAETLGQLFIGLTGTYLQSRHRSSRFRVILHRIREQDYNGDSVLARDGTRKRSRSIETWLFLIEQRPRAYPAGKAGAAPPNETVGNRHGGGLFERSLRESARRGGTPAP